MRGATAGAFLLATIAFLVLTYLGSKHVQPRGIMLDAKQAVIARRNKGFFIAGLAMTAVSGLCVIGVVVGSELVGWVHDALPLLLVAALALLVGAVAAVLLQRRSIRG